MVVGRSSQFIEGFENVTVDDKLLYANFQQAMNQL